MSNQQLRSYVDKTTASISSDRLEKPGIEPVTSGVKDELTIHYNTKLVRYMIWLCIFPRKLEANILSILSARSISVTNIIARVSLIFNIVAYVKFVKIRQKLHKARRGGTDTRTTKGTTQNHVVNVQRVIKMKFYILCHIVDQGNSVCACTITQWAKIYSFGSETDLGLIVKSALLTRVVNLGTTTKLC